MSSAYPPQQYPPQAPPKKRHTGLIVLAVIGVLALLGLAGCLAFVVGVAGGEDPDTVTAAPVASKSAPAASKPASKPVDESSEKPAAKPYTLKVTKCARGEYGSFDVIVKITNNTDDETTYWFDVGLYDPKGNTVGEGFGSIEVKPGKSGTTDAGAYLDDDDYKGKVTCEIKVTDW